MAEGCDVGLADSLPYMGIGNSHRRRPVQQDVAEHLTTPHLRGANLSGVDLTNARLTDADLKNAKGCDTRTEPSPILPGC